MGPLISDLAESAGITLRDARGLRLVMATDAPAFLEACLGAGCRIVGIEGFEIVNDAIRPDMDAIADFSELNDPVESVAEARRFLDAVRNEDLGYEFVLSRSE